VSNDSPKLTTQEQSSADRIETAAIDQLRRKAWFLSIWRCWPVPPHCYWLFRHERDCTVGYRIRDT
jgi:hypothetical protein